MRREEKEAKRNDDQMPKINIDYHAVRLDNSVAVCYVFPLNCIVYSQQMV